MKHSFGPHVNDKICLNCGLKIEFTATVPICPGAPKPKRFVVKHELHRVMYRVSVVDEKGRHIKTLGRVTDDSPKMFENLIGLREGVKGTFDSLEAAESSEVGWVEEYELS